jgi:effector-binding domain-containing protein
MKILKFLLYSVLTITTLVVVLGLFARKNYHVQRTLDIRAPRDTVYEQVRFFKNMAKWSPWNKIDPDMQASFGGTDGAPGATYTWNGNSDVGKGVQTLKSTTRERTEIEVSMKDPWKSSSMSVFALQALDSANTRVVWDYDLYVGFPWNAMAMLTDVDRGVGKDFERGLGNLKKLCEKLMNPRYNGFAVEEVEMGEMHFIGVRDTLRTVDVPKFYSEHTAKILVSLLDGKTEPKGPATGIYWRWDEKNLITDLATAFPVAADVKPATGYKTFSIPAGQALSIDYFGPYDSLGNVHKGMKMYLTEKKLEALSPFIESYVTDPGKEPDTAKWLTKVVYWIKKDSIK